MFGNVPLGALPLGGFSSLLPVAPTGPQYGVRQPTGKLFTLDTRDNYHFGEWPWVNESCVMILYLGKGFHPTAKPFLFFTLPDGSLQDCDPDYCFVGTPAILQRYIPDFPARQYIVYTFGKGELWQWGTWHVRAAVGYYESSLWPFQVLNPPLTA